MVGNGDIMRRVSPGEATERRGKRGRLHALVQTAAFATMVTAASILTESKAIAQQVSVDKLSYSVGETVNITGQGWQPQEVVTLLLSNANETRAKVIQLATGSDGSFQSADYAIDDLDRDQLVTLKAQGEAGTETLLAFRAGLAPGALKCPALSASNTSSYGLSYGEAVSCSIEGATDLSAAQQSGAEPVEVSVACGSIGARPATVSSVSGSTVYFSWSSPSDACDVSTVNYGPVKACEGSSGRCATLATEGNHANNSIISGSSGGATGGFAIVDRYGNATSSSAAPPRLRVETFPKNGAFAPESQGVFTVVVSNTSAAEALAGVQLVDQLPGNGGLIWETVSTSQGSCVDPPANNLLNCALGDIAPQGSVTLTAKTAATTSVAGCRWQPDPAAVATAANGVSAKGSGYLTCTPMSPAQLTVAIAPMKTSFSLGEQITYKIYVKNPAPSGSAPAKNVELQDELPGNGGLTWSSVSTSAGSCTLRDNRLSCKLGDILPQRYASIIVKATATTPFDACQQLPIQPAVATADGGLTAEDVAFAACTALPPPLVSVAVSPQRNVFYAGSQAKYTITVTNPAAPGSAPAKNVQVGFGLPGYGGLTWTSMNATQGGCSLSSNNLACALGEIPAGGTATVTVSTPASTPIEACTYQGSATAMTTADDGLFAADIGYLGCTPGCGPSHPILDKLASAGPTKFAVLSLGGDASHPKAGINCSNGTVNGNVGIIGEYGLFNNAAPCTETGDFYKGGNVAYKGPGKLQGKTITMSPESMQQLRTAVFKAASDFAALPVSPLVQAQFPSDGNISGNITVTGSAGMNVVYLPGLKLNGNLTLAGPPGARFILNIDGPFNLHSGNIVARGGVGQYDVIYNITDPTASVVTMVPTTAFGILLAPYNAITPMDSANFYGTIIGGYNKVINLLSATRVVPPKVTETEIPCPLPDFD